MKNFCFFILFLFLSCSNTQEITKENDVSLKVITQSDLKKFVGKKITITGKSINVKNGAFIETDRKIQIWMDEMESWPDGYYYGKENAKTLKVTGVLIKKNDLPVYIPDEKNSKYFQGIPMPKGTDLKKAHNRYLLKDCKWIETN